MRKIIIVCFFIAAVNMFSSCTPVTVDTFCSVSGIVVESGTNEPLQGVIVTLQGEGIEKRTETTSSDGTFFFGNLDIANKQVRLIAQKSGYESNWVTTIPLPGETMTVTIPLTPKNK